MPFPIYLNNKYINKNSGKKTILKEIENTDPVCIQMQWSGV